MSIPQRPRPSCTRELIDDQSKRASSISITTRLPRKIDAVAELAAMGALGFKVYMVVDAARSYPHMPGSGSTNTTTSSASWRRWRRRADR